MPQPNERRNVRRNALDHFPQREKRDSALKREQEKARIAEQDKTARLRALRLAKEDAETKEKDIPSGAN